MINKTLGILGGGQLGRMTAMAAARLGIKTHVFAPEENCPGRKVATFYTRAQFDDRKALKDFAESVDAVTYEFENIPLETIRRVQQIKPVCPNETLLAIAQDRVKEKKFLNDIGIDTTRWCEVNNPEDIQKALILFGKGSCIIKTTRFGYDGKGQKKHETGEDIYESFHSLVPSRSTGIKLIAEDIVDFSSEISVIVARDKLGQTAVYPPALNEHRNHILYKSTVPAPIPEQQAEAAKRKAELLANAVDLVGVLAIEFFITHDGQILANEIAPRPHNSGHWTIDACAVSQFEQHARTVSGLPIGYPRRHSDAVMVNLIGRDVRNAPRFLEAPNTCLHLYGKSSISEGRKMGHVTVVKAIGSQVGMNIEEILSISEK